MANMDLELFKEVFKDKKTHIAIAKIKQISMVADRSALKCLVAVFPDNREVVARMTWEMTGPNSGIVEFPAVNDLVLVAFADGENDYCFVIRRMSSREDNLPLKAVDGHLVLKSKSGKQAWLTGQDKIMLSKGDTVPTENLVLGQQLKSLLSYLLGQLAEQSDQLKTLANEIKIHQHIGNLGYPVGQTLNPTPFQTAETQMNTKKTNYNTKKASPVDDQIILSDFAFTEKGS